MKTEAMLRCKRTRKLMRALSSRRWEKKMCKTLTAQLGYPVLAVKRKGG